MLTGAHFALGIALVTRNNAHIRIDFLYSRMPVRFKYLLDFTILFFSMVPLIMWVSVSLVEYAWRSWVIGETSGESGWNPLVWPVRAAIATGFVIFSAQLISEAIKTGYMAFCPNSKNDNR